MDIGLGFGLPQWQLPISITMTFINFAFHFSSSPQLPSVEMLAVKRQLWSAVGTCGEREGDCSV